jgi:hypothetical protein
VITETTFARRPAEESTSSQGTYLSNIGLDILQEDCTKTYADPDRLKSHCESGFSDHLKRIRVHLKLHRDPFCNSIRRENKVIL